MTETCRDVLIGVDDPELSSIRVTRDLGSVIAVDIFEVPNVSPIVVAMVKHLDRVSILRGERK